MHENYAESLLRMGIIEARAGSHETARRYLERALESGISDRATAAEAWFWLAEIASDPAEKRRALEEVLARDPSHARARRALAILDGKLNPQEVINPDALPAQPAGDIRPAARRFTCPDCGARMIFAPDGGSLVCEHCGRRETPQSFAPAPEQDFLVAMATERGHRAPIAQQVFHCKGCGAEFLLPPALISSTCAYCGSPHIVSLEGSRELIAPEAVLPHAFTEAQASTHLLQWMMSTGMAETRAAPLRGMYLPVWTFDLGGEIKYTGQMVQHEERQGESVPGVRVVEDGWPIHVDDLAVPGCRNLSDSLNRLLHTFNLSQLAPYDPRYLADWPAEVYDIPMAEASLEARARAYRRLLHDLPAQVSPLRLLSSSSAGIVIESFKLVLLPVWITRLPRKGREEVLLVNGHNGAVTGSASEKKGLWDWLAGALQE